MIYLIASPKRNVEPGSIDRSSYVTGLAILAVIQKTMKNLWPPFNIRTFV